VTQSGHRPKTEAAQKRDDGTFSREDFSYDEVGDVYFCPNGKILETTGRIVKDRQRL